MLVSHLPSDAFAECVHITHRLSTRVCRANELASSFLSVWEQNLFSPKRSGKRGHAACRCLYPWLPIYTASDTTKLRDDQLLPVKNRKKSTLRYYIQLTSRACSARSSLAASLPSAVSVDWVFKKKNDDIHEANIRAQIITDHVNCLDFIYRAKKNMLHKLQKIGYNMRCTLHQPQSNIDHD